MVNQAGIYAGQDGFTINVGDITKLVGSVIASDTDNNSLKTKNLVMEDIENKAKYSYESKGLSYLNDKSVNKYSDKYNELGLTPNIMPGEKGKADSTTYSSIAKGKLEVENSNIDVNSIRRNTKNSLNKLNEIFDKQSIEERQQTAALLGKYANEAIHRFGEIKNEKGEKKYKEGSPEKVALHALAGAITASITKGNVASGAVAGGLNEALINEITKLAKDKPDAAQMLSAGLGYAVNKIAGGNGYSGASITQAGTKWNLLSYWLNSTTDLFQDILKHKDGTPITREEAYLFQKEIATLVHQENNYDEDNDFSNISDGGELGIYTAKYYLLGKGLDENSIDIALKSLPKKSGIENNTSEFKGYTNDGMPVYDLPPTTVTAYESSSVIPEYFKVFKEDEEKNLLIDKYLYGIVGSLDSAIDNVTFNIASVIKENILGRPYLYNNQDYFSGRLIGDSIISANTMMMTGSILYGSAYTGNSYAVAKDIPITSVAVASIGANSFLNIVNDSRIFMASDRSVIQPRRRSWSKYSDELKRTKPKEVDSWNKGTFDTVEDSIGYHYEKHGKEVGAKDINEYLRKAEGFWQKKQK